MSGAFRNCSVTGWLLLPGWSPIGGDDLECSRCQVRASFNVLSFVCARGSYAQPPVSGVLPGSDFLLAEAQKHFCTILPVLQPISLSTFRPYSKKIDPKNNHNDPLSVL